MPRHFNKCAQWLRTAIDRRSAQKSPETQVQPTKNQQGKLQERTVGREFRGASTEFVTSNCKELTQVNLIIKYLILDMRSNKFNSYSA
ncbi:hypothetical protein B5S31_g40 [[Candida] boidinii]|nr:hypothetical protein B5S29_g156 [[Candida] boidinii]OWB70363.1 hypothetical protein B5S31_g40 [[Candida] boidinii]